MPYTLNASVTPPKTERRAKKITQLGRERTDDYFWLKDPHWQKMMSAPETLDKDIRAHLEAENTYHSAVTAPLAPLSDAIFEEMKGRMEPEEASVPAPDGKYAYYHRYRKGDQHGVYVRKAFDAQTREAMGDEIIMIDADAVAAEVDGDFFSLGAVQHSPDHKWLAYTVDRNGSETYEIFLRDIDTGEARTTAITTSAGGVQWAADSQTLFWVERDENQRPYAVFAKDVHDAAASPRLIYKETDPGFFVSVGESESGRYIEISAHNHITSEVHRLRANTPSSNPACVSPREENREYSLHETGDDVYILTNTGGATDFKIMKAKDAAAEASHWEEFIPHTPGSLILGAETYAHHLVWLVRENALPIIRIMDLRSGEQHEIAFDEQAYGLGLVGGYEFDTPWLRFTYSSPTTPRQIFDYHMDRRERVLLKTQSVPSGHTPSDYTCERLLMTVRGGETVPVTLLYRADTKPSPDTPILLYGYGSYGITIPAAFRTGVLSIVDRGFVFAIAHIRGSMAKGYQWYLDGKLAKKQNTFNDFVDVGRGLVDMGYTSRGNIVAQGGSAGGLLVGAAVNQDPSLFGGVIGAVPFVDVLNTMSDAELPLTPPEWPEWGNPLESEEDYDRLLAYSPYDNITEAAYPPMLITGGLTDPRVTYWEPAKWAAKLRDHQKGPAPILLKMNMDAGHAGVSGRYDSLKETAHEYAFAIAALQSNAAK